MSEKVPVIKVSPAGWKAIGSGGAIFGAVCLVGLIAVVALEDGDALASIALVLAISAFVVQIIVSALQNSASRAAEAESAKLNFETNKVLEQIKSSAAANQEILARQFDTLLEALVKDRLRAEGAQEGESEDAPSEGEEPTPDLRELSKQFSLLATEPIEDDRIAEMLQSFPSKEESEPLLRILDSLPPSAVAMLERYVANEVKARKRGSTPGLKPSEAPLAKSARRHLADAGLLREKDDKYSLTNTGIQVARLIRATDDPPDNVRTAFSIDP